MDGYDFHFIAIGGVGQSALAKILLQQGYKVSGSDLNESKYTKIVEKLGAKVFIGQNENNIKGKPTIVISSAIKEDNPELLKAKQLNLKIMHRSDCLKFISEEFETFIGLSGTHGKTTTSGMLSFIMEKIQLNPAYAIGGILPYYNTNANSYKNSKYFIAELDESDGSIIKYHPDYLVINNLEADHLDFYKNGLDDILKTFKTTVQNVKPEGKVFINIDNKGNNKLLKIIEKNNIITYSIENNADYQAKNIIYDDFNTTFEIYKKDNLLGKINLIIPGKHNIYNALAICAILDTLGLKFEEYAKYFREFSGMGRRFQIVADIKNIKIIDDYAHHPTEIKTTLSAVENIKKRKVAIFQPHRYTRLKGLWDEFLESFNSIDKLYVLDVFSAGDKPLDDYNSKNFAYEIAKKGINATYIQGDIAKAAEKIAPELCQNDIVLTLGAGDITKIGGMINDLLTK